MSVVSKKSGGRTRALWVGIVAVVAVSLMLVVILSQVGWDATVFIGFGEDEILTRTYAEDRLGEVRLRPAQGHDGKFFFVQANDPWVLDPDQNASVLTRPLYRSQRMLYPLMAGAGGTLNAEAIVWGLLIVNIAAMGVGTWAVALLAVKMDMSPWWGLTFVFNIGLICEMIIDGAGIVAAAAAFGACAVLLRDKTAWGILLLVLAALAREAMLIAAVGAAWWLWRYRDQKQTAALAFAIPVGAVGLWAIYLRLQIGLESGVAQVQEIGLPFAGFIEALEGWRSDPLDLAAGVAIMILFVLYTRRVLASEHLVGWAFLGFVVLGVVLSRPVWQSYFDITRAIAPVITAFVLLVFAPNSEVRRTRVRP